MGKTLSESGVETVDGRPVEIYETKFINVTQMDSEDGIGIADGDTVCMLITVMAETPKFVSVKKSGQLKRQNQFRVIDVEVLDPDVAKKMYKELYNEVQPKKDNETQPVSSVTKLGFDPGELE